MRKRFILPAVVIVVATGCDDPFDVPQLNTVSDTVTLHSLSRPELQGLPSAFDFVARIVVVLETLPQGGDFDIALVDDGGGLALAPASALTGSASRAGVSVDATRSFEEVTRAEGDTAAYVRVETVPLATGRVYIIRTRRAGGCVFYAKMEALELDEAEGRLRFRYLYNPNCGDRDLVPPEA